MHVCVGCERMRDGGAGLAKRRSRSSIGKQRVHVIPWVSRVVSSRLCGLGSRPKPKKKTMSRERSEFVGTGRSAVCLVDFDRIGQVARSPACAPRTMKREGEKSGPGCVSRVPVPAWDRGLDPSTIVPISKSRSMILATRTGTLWLSPAAPTRPLVPTLSSSHCFLFTRYSTHRRVSFPRVARTFFFSRLSTSPSPTGVNGEGGPLGMRVCAEER